MLSINPKLTGAETLRILKTTANPSGRWGCGAGLLDAALALDMTAGVPVEQDRWPRATWAGARSSAAATSADGLRIVRR
jgi:hypothetical protein